MTVTDITNTITWVDGDPIYEAGVRRANVGPVKIHDDGGMITVSCGDRHRFYYDMPSALAAVAAILGD